MKYVIEVEDNPFVGPNGEQLYRVKGFNSLVFDSIGLSRLQKYEDVFSSDLSMISKKVLDTVDKYKDEEPKLTMDMEKKFIYDRPTRKPVIIDYTYDVANPNTIYPSPEDITNSMNLLSELKNFYN